MPRDMYEELLRYQMELRGITDEKAKKLVVMTEVGPKAYMELKNALAGKALKDVATADELLMLLQKRYSLKKLLIAERHRMLLLGQEPGQSLAEFYSRIQEAANSCDFHSSEVHDMMVLQVFVKGMRSEGSRAALLQKEKLKPEEALELAQVMNVAESESHKMGTGGHQEVHQVKAKSRGDSKCHECGKRGHLRAECPNTECYNCGKGGHIAKNRRAKTKRFSHHGVNYASARQNSSRSSNSSSSESMRMCLRVETQGPESTYVKSCPKPMKVSVTMAGRSVRMALDTGSPVTIVSKET